MSGYTRPVLEGYLKALDAFEAAEDSYLKTTAADRSKIVQEDVLDYFSSKAGALIDNIDMLANWCMYKNTCLKLRSLGLSFISDALESGRLTSENVLAGFEKNVAKNFLELAIPQDADLSRLSAGTLEDTVEKFRTMWEDFSLATRRHIRSDLISRLPAGGRRGEPFAGAFRLYPPCKEQPARLGASRALFRGARTSAPHLPLHADEPHHGGAVSGAAGGSFRPRHLRRGVADDDRRGRGVHRPRQGRRRRGRSQTAPSDRLLSLCLCGRGESGKRRPGKRTRRLPRPRHARAPPHLALSKPSRIAHRLFQQYVLRRRAISESSLRPTRSKAACAL